MTKIQKLGYEKNSVNTFNSHYNATEEVTEKLVAKCPQNRVFYYGASTD